MLNTQEISQHHFMSTFEDMGTNLEEFEFNIFNNKSHLDSNRAPLHQPSTDIYDFSQGLPTRNKYNNTISTTNTDKIRSLKQQASPFMQKKVTTNMFEQSSTNWQGQSNQ